MNAQSYLAKLCASTGCGAATPVITPEHEERLRFELDVIEKTGFGHVLFDRPRLRQLRAPRRHLFRRARLCGGQHVLLLSSDITDVDPMEYGLTFERFLNPERLSMPDIDMDFEDGRRQEVIDYVVRTNMAATGSRRSSRSERSPPAPLVRDCRPRHGQAADARDRQALQDDPDHPRRDQDRRAPSQVNPEFKAAYDSASASAKRADRHRQAPGRD